MNSVHQYQIQNLVNQYNLAVSERDQLILNSESLKPKFLTDSVYNEIYERLFPDFLGDGKHFRVAAYEGTTTMYFQDNEEQGHWGVFNVTHYISFGGVKTSYRVIKYKDFYLRTNSNISITSERDVFDLQMIAKFMEQIISKKQELISAILNVTYAYDKYNEVRGKMLTDVDSRIKEIKSNISKTIFDINWNIIQNDGITFDNKKHDNFIFFTEKDRCYLSRIKILNFTKSGKSCIVDYTTSYGYVATRTVRVSVLKSFVELLGIDVGNGETKTRIRNLSDIIKYFTLENELVTT